MRRTLATLTAVAPALVLATSARAQESGVAAPCQRSDVPSAARAICLSAAQAAAAAGPQIGILAAGGNPMLGSASTAGLRIGPGIAATARVNVVAVRLPAIAGELRGDDGGERAGFLAPAASATASVRLAPGAELSPTVAGIGSLELVGTGSWIPLQTLDVSSFRLESAEFAYGVGVRIGILRESFTLPGASLTLLYRRMDEVSYGNVCAAPVVGTSTAEDGYSFTAGTCPGSGDPGEFSLQLTDWSARGVIGKQVRGFGLAAGAGYDRFEPEVGYGFRAPSGSIPGQARYVARARGLSADDDRWSLFADASFTSLVTTFAVEAGWMQGGDAVAGFPSAADFDPRSGVWFGSLGVRLAF